MNDSIKEISVLEDNSNLFDTDMGYSIPLYQRAYAWQEKQLIQLLEDINDLPEDGEVKYHIGTLIVSKQSGKYEVVDGQQRLTSLYLLLKCLGINTKPTLVFACRNKSNYTIQNIEALLHKDYSKLDMDQIEQSMQRGIKIISEELSKKVYDKESFINKLKKVTIYRITVPEKTDLNRYFEVMNTRGEQLEQYDILKATLMGYLSDAAEKTAFAKIWDACSDMTGYVQMRFFIKERDGIFKSAWGTMPSDSWSDYLSIFSDSIEATTEYTIADLIANDFQVNEDDGYVDNDIRVRFESIIDFPYFLLHTLKVYIELNNMVLDNENLESVNVPLDDKKLCDVFKWVVSYGSIENKKIADDKENFARSFIIYLLRTRYLFDKYIIKREYTSDNTDGEWSLKSLCVSGTSSNRKAYYKNTYFTVKHDDSIDDNRTKTNIMIQSALRVSYTSPKVMHWINKLLIWLSKLERENNLVANIVDFNEQAEAIAKESISKNYFNECKTKGYELGTETPHIVFNYLDYLLWKEDKKKYEDFVFEFRNSVEHWYPQNPSEGTFKQWDNVDRFGNLCIIQRNVNAKFSNMSPEAKKSTFEKMINKGSIKLRIMRDLTNGSNGMNASEYWKECACKEHEKKMIEKLKKKCGVVD